MSLSAFRHLQHPCLKSSPPLFCTFREEDTPLLRRTSATSSKGDLLWREYVDPNGRRFSESPEAQIVLSPEWSGKRARVLPRPSSGNTANFPSHELRVCPGELPVFAEHNHIDCSDSGHSDAGG